VIPTDGAKKKSAAELARRLALEVSAAGWPVGRSLGSEDELLRRYGVGRGVLREAIRLLERDAVAVMKRGPSGGLVVTEPSVASVAYSVSIHLLRRGLGPRDVLETRKALELAAVDRVLDRFDDAAAEAIEAQLHRELGLDETATVDDLQRFHGLLASLTGDSAMELFIDVMLHITHDRWRRAGGVADAVVVDKIVRAHRAIGRSLLARDRMAARGAMKRHLDAFRGLLA
jgi:DNA-binding FadR family transcriptional regulator